jgi:hypothetical protein
MKFDNKFFVDLGTSAGVTQLCVDAAERIAEHARASAPVDTGDYRDGIKVEVKHHAKLRNVALVVGHDRKTMLIESKTGNLARALKASRGGR